MLKIHHLIFILIPAFIIVALALFIRVIQYQPMTPQTVEQQKEQALLAVPIMPKDPILGNKKAPITIIAFEDFGCEACKYQDNLLNQILEKYPDKVKIVWKGLSVTTFPFPTKPAHGYAYCANEQHKFSEFKNLAFANSESLSTDILNTIATEIELEKNKLEQCLNSEETARFITESENIARFFNIQSVPTFFVNNQQITNPTSFEGWEALTK